MGVFVGAADVFKSPFGSGWPFARTSSIKTGGGVGSGAELFKSMATIPPSMANHSVPLGEFKARGQPWVGAALGTESDR